MMMTNVYRNLIFINQKPSLNLKFLNLTTIRSIHSNYNVLLKQTVKFNHVNSFASKFNRTKDSLISSHLSLFLRRNRFFSNKNTKVQEKVKVKVKSDELKRLLSLAKPDRHKIAGKFAFQFFSSNYCQTLRNFKI